MLERDRRLTVPGLPVKLMCKVGVSCRQSQLPASTVDEQQCRRLADSLFDRCEPDELAIEHSQHILDPGGLELRTEVDGGEDDRFSDGFSGGGHDNSCYPLPQGEGKGVLTRIPFASRLIRGVGRRRVVHDPARALLARKLEPRLLGRSIDDERQPDRLPAQAGVEGDDTNIAVAINLAAFAQFHHQRRRIGIVEHRVSPHVPIGVARVEDRR
jgi:hypothetical protein